MSQVCPKYVYGWGDVWGYRKSRVAFKGKRQPLPWHHLLLAFLLLSSLFFLSLSCFLFSAYTQLRCSPRGLHSWTFSVLILNSWSHYWKESTLSFCLISTEILRDSPTALVCGASSLCPWVKSSRTSESSDPPQIGGSQSLVTFCQETVSFESVRW